MTGVWVGLGLGVALVLQTTLLPMVSGREAPVDLVLIVVVYVGLAHGPSGGVWAGTAGGLVQDALSGGVVGVGGISKTLVGYAAGQFGLQFLVAQPWHHVSVFFVASLADAACFVGIHNLLFDEGIVFSYSGVLTRAVSNAVVGVVLVQTMGWAPGAFERRRSRRRTRVRRFIG